MSKEYYTFEQALKILNMEAEELFRLVEEGEFRLFRDHQGMKFLKEHIDNFVLTNATFTNLTSPMRQATPGFEPGEKKEEVMMLPEVEKESIASSAPLPQDKPSPKKVTGPSQLITEEENLVLSRYKFYSKICERYKKTNNLFIFISALIGTISTFSLLRFHSLEEQWISELHILFLSLIALNFLSSLLIALYSNIFLNRGQHSLELTTIEKNTLFSVLKKVLVRGIVLKDLAQFLCTVGIVISLVFLLLHALYLNWVMGLAVISIAIVVFLYCHYSRLKQRMDKILTTEKEKMGL